MSKGHSQSNRPQPLEIESCQRENCNPLSYHWLTTVKGFEYRIRMSRKIDRYLDSAIQNKSRPVGNHRKRKNLHM